MTLARAFGLVIIVAASVLAITLELRAALPSTLPTCPSYETMGPS